MIPGKRINLWGIEKADLLQNYLWGNDPEILKLTGIDPIPKTETDIERWYTSICNDPNNITLAIKMQDGTYIGNIGLANIDWRSRKAEIGIVIGHRQSRKMGFGTEAVEMICRFAFEELGFHRIYCNLIPFNTASEKLFEKCGFTKEGTERESYYTWGRWWDLVTYSILDREFYKKFPYPDSDEAPSSEEENKEEENKTKED